MAAPLDVTQISPRGFESTRITSMLIPHHVQILCSSCFSYCNSLSSISFETESELIRIDSCSFHGCSSLKSITIPHHVQILCSSCFSDCNSLSSISFETESELTRIDSCSFHGCSSFKSITNPHHVQILC
jgi:Pyruvate/2-oxoacid:ferredoxin oxidoreductase delta subunit